jgi:hypothetical protein
VGGGGGGGVIEGRWAAEGGGCVLHAGMKRKAEMPGRVCCKVRARGSDLAARSSELVRGGREAGLIEAWHLTLLFCYTLPSPPGAGTSSSGAPSRPSPSDPLVCFSLYTSAALTPRIQVPFPLLPPLLPPPHQPATEE